MDRGVLRVYLGAAPGVGKTVAMLDEAHRRRERGVDVVVGVVETHGRARTAARIGDLEMVPTRATGDGRHGELDLDAVLRRHPAVVLIDDLAHTNAPGSRHPRRWQDVEELLDAGIDVVTTLNVEHLESLRDVVERITGTAPVDTVPDVVVRRADQIELVDMSPEALRRRLAHGNVFPPERVDAALADYFRPGTLGALRELALLWAADRVEDALASYRAEQGIQEPWETRERVVVAVTGAPGGEALVRRAARLAERSRGELVGVHVDTSGRLDPERPEGDDALARVRDLVVHLGGTYAEVRGDDVPRALVDAARAHGATQLVLGASGRSRLAELTGGSVIAETIRRAGGIDVHVMAADGGSAPRTLPRHRRWQSPLPRRRQVTGWVVALVGLPALTALLETHHGTLSFATELLLYLALVVAIGAIGGPPPGITAAVVGSLLANYFLVEPRYTLRIYERENVIALVVFLAVAATVSLYVDLAAHRELAARRAHAAAAALARSAGTLATSPDPLPQLLDQLRTTFGAARAELRHRRDGAWVTAAQAERSQAPASTDGDAGTETIVALDDDRRLVLTGPPLDADDRLVLRTHVDQLSVALQTRALREDAARAAVVREADELRTSLLRAVSHDLRTPLASIKASVTSLLADDVAWGEDDRRDFLRTVDAETDRLARLVGNLLDMSRLQAGVVTLQRAPTPIDDVVASALASVSGLPDDVVVELAEDLPLVDVDPELLERAVANVVANAVAWSPPGRPVRVEAGAHAGRVHVRVVDRGPGIAEAHRAAVRRPFQRSGDGGGSPAGVGLGLAVADGFVRVLGGELVLDDTPGGGLTIDIVLPAIEDATLGEDATLPSAPTPASARPEAP